MTDQIQPSGNRGGDGKSLIRVRPRGFCAGVVRAVDIVELALQAYGPPVYVHHEIVHNRYVVEQLRESGAIFVEAVEEVPLGAVLVFSAHGVPPTTREEARLRELRVIDATCPLVTKVHLEALKFAREKDIRLFIELSHSPTPAKPEDVPLTALVPAYVISELKASFQIGAVLFLPFLVIDMAVASVTLSIGMMQLPPAMISAPFKILLFVLVDGWNLVIGSLMKSFYQ